MKKILFIFLFISKLYAQNIIKNGGFESLVEPLLFYDCNYSINNIPGGGLAGDARCFPFWHEKVPNWKNYSFSPEIVTSIAYPGITGNAATFAFITTTSNGTSTFYEAIFQQNDSYLKNGIPTIEPIFKNGKSYIVSFKFKFINGSLGFVNPSIKLIAGLFNEDRNLPGTSPKNNINNLNNDLIGITPNTLAENQWHYFKTYYTPTSNKEGFAILPVGLGGGVTSATLIYDDIIITETCCIPNVVYNNVTNPPSANVQDYIRCNSDVTFTNSSNTYLAAKNEILLQNNTFITDVASFVATAEDCLAKPVELYTQIVQAKCKFKVFLSACYGSGQYEFYFGEELSENKVKDYSLVNAGSSITVKVKDLVSGLIVSKVITLPTNDSTLNPNPTKYKGAFTFNIGNVFTPNGDGINDVFRVIDSSKARFAYNAYAYKFWVWNRWGNNLLELEKEIPDDDINGFNDQEIFWNGRKWQNEGDMVNNGTYYYLLQFNNCTEAQIENDTIKGIRGTITLIKRNNFTEQTSIKEEINNNNFKSEIFPNPANGSIKLKLFVNDNNNPFLKITDIMGKEQLVKYTLIENKNGVIVYEIDCSQLNNGIYFCTIFKNNTTETIKFSIVK